MTPKSPLKITFKTENLGLHLAFVVVVLLVVAFPAKK